MITQVIVAIIAPYNIGKVINWMGTVLVPRVFTTSVPKIRGATVRERKRRITPKSGCITLVEIIDPSNTPPSFAPINI
jgi:hypothetical protein